MDSGLPLGFNCSSASPENRPGWLGAFAARELICLMATGIREMNRKALGAVAVQAVNHVQPLFDDFAERPRVLLPPRVYKVGR